MSSPATAQRWAAADLQEAVRSGAVPLVFQDYHIPAETRDRPPLPSYPPGQSVNFFRELFFAGFPCAAPHESALRGRAGGAAAVADNTLYSSRALLKVFGQFGEIVGFMYDEFRGMGCITYARGEDAESCFMAMNNAIVPGPVGNPAIKGLQMVDEVGTGLFEGEGVAAGSAGRRGARDYVITCDFARCMPFVSPYLLLKDDFASLDLSRSLMRNFPVPDAAADGRLGERPCAAWVAAAHVVEPAPPADTEAAAAAPSTSPAVPPAAKEDCVFVGPVFEDSLVDLENPLFRAAYALLRPSNFTKQPGCGLPRLKLWWEYYNLYVVHKTEPSQDRIANKRDFLAASCASVTQEVLELCRDAHQRNQRADQASPHSLLRRLVYDDVYLYTLNAVILRQKFRLDAAFTSFMRDLYTNKIAAAFVAYRARVPLEADPHLMRLRLLAQRGMEQADRHNDETIQAQGNGAVALTGAERAADDAAYAAHPKVQAWFSMPLLEVAANIVTNVKHLRRIKKGEVGPDGSDRAAPLKSSEEDLGYPGMSLKQADADLFDEITTNLNGFCGDGSLFSLLLLGESPEAFRCEPGHLGLEEARQYHAKHARSFWRDTKDIAKALVVPIIFISCIIMIINHVTAVAPTEDGVVHPAPPRAPVRRPTREGHPTVAQQRAATDTVESNRAAAMPDLEALMREVEADPSAAAERQRQAMRAATERMRRMKEEAEKRGTKFNIELNADL